MNFLLQRTFIVLLAPFILCVLPTSAVSQHRVAKLSTPDDLKAEFASVPCDDKDRLNAAKALFKKAGAPATSLSVEKYKNVENLVITKAGTSREKIVIGAHYDKVADGCGAIDNWTGIVTLAHLYASVKDTAFEKTLIFVAFGKEEKGLIGSRAMAESLSKEEVGEYCAMINMDSFGLSGPQVLDNASSKKLRDLVEEMAKEMKIPFGHASVAADSDSSSFLKKNIPAVTIHGLNNDWPKILHGRQDQAGRINAVSVYLGYRLTLAVMSRLDSTVCNAYR